MSAFGGKAEMTICGNPLLRSLLGVKRTWRFVGPSLNEPQLNRYDGLSLALRRGMRRREFISLLSGAATWPLAARAQQTMPVVGFLNAAIADHYKKFTNEFRRGLREMGFVEGQNVVVEYRWAEAHYERLPDLAADLISRRVAVIAATSTPAALAAKKATATIPVVFTTGSDPVEVELVSSIARPGGNVTGSTQITMELGPKRLELLHQLFPKATVLALAVNPANPAVAKVQFRDAQDAARALGLQLEILQASTEEEFDKALDQSAATGRRPCHCWR